MPITGLIGNQFGDEDDLYGKRPVVPEAPNYARELRKTIGQDIGMLPRIEELAEKSTELYRNLIEKATPGSLDIMDSVTANIQSMLAGELPKDVEENLRRYGAEAGAASGTGGSEFARNRTARDLGLSSLSLTQQGIGAAERWLASSQNRTFDFSKMFLGPQDAMRQADTRFNRDWLANQVAAAPDPGTRGAFDSEMAFIGMVLSAYGGGAGYTGASRPNYGGGGGPAADDPRYNRYASDSMSYFNAPDYGSSYEGDVNVYPGVESMA